jgi:chorismate mutase-like protein
MNLDDWRSRINDLDEQILNLLNQRAQAALHIGELKRQQDLPYFVPAREAQVFARLTALNAGPMPAEGVRAIWREILSAALALEHPLTVAFLGPSGSFGHQAAMQRFGSSAQLLPVVTNAAIFDEVERGRAEFGVVPVENSTEGAVNVTLDRLLDSDVLIVGELTLEIAQHLISRATSLDEIKVVCSHPQGLAQCRQWLAAHLPDVRTEEMASTSGAAERAAADRHRLRDGGAHPRRPHPPPPDRGQPVQLHPFPRPRPPRHAAHRPGQDVDRVLDEERARRALQHPRPHRGAPAQPHQDRVAADEAPALGVRELRRLRGPPRHR